MRPLAAAAKAEADAERKRRFEAEAERQRRGKNRQGQAPKEVEETPADKAQMSCTAPALHLMQTNNTGWDYWGNAPASVAGAYPSMVACDVTAATNDKQQAAPLGQAILEPLQQADIAPRRNAAGEGQAIPATGESGSYSEAAPPALEALGVEPYSAPARQRPQAPAPEALASSATAQERMTAKVRSPAGQAGYSRRTGIVAPVFGQLKEARGGRRFLLRGWAKVRGAGRLVGLGHNLLKLWRSGRALRTVEGRQRHRRGAPWALGGWGGHRERLPWPC
jgi:DDE family transposase